MDLDLIISFVSKRNKVCLRFDLKSGCVCLYASTYVTHRQHANVLVLSLHPIQV